MARLARHDLEWLATARLMVATGASAGTITGLLASAGRQALDSGAGLPGEDGMSQDRTGVLGRYFEDLVAFALGKAPMVKDLHRNLPVRDGGQTLGELDFLFRLADDWHHLEVAVKYYLFAGQDDAFADYRAWQGPGLRDNLARKTQIMTRQTSVIPEAATRLGIMAAAGCPRPPASCGLVYGMLFLPIDMMAQAASLADNVPGLQPDTDIGWWMTEQAFADMGPGVVQVLDKLDWLAGQPGRTAQVASGEIPRTGRPVMVRLTEPSDIPERGFIVPNDWPERASQVYRDISTD